MRSLLQEATGEEVSIERAVNDGDEVSALHRVEGLLEVLERKGGKVHFGPSSLQDAGELLKLCGALTSSEEGPEGFAGVDGSASVPLHGLGNSDHDEVRDVVRRLEALGELAEGRALADDLAKQAKLAVVLAGIEERKKVSDAFGRGVGECWSVHLSSGLSWEAHSPCIGVFWIA